MGGVKKGDKVMILSQVQPVNIAPVAKPPGRPGRKKRLFSPDWDKKNGRMGWFVGYCECGCGGKAILPWQMMDELKTQVARRKRSLTYRLLKALLSHYEN